MIPKNIFMTWHTKDLPYHMKQNVEKIKRENPEFNVYVYDDEDCRKFLREHFDPKVLDAYNSLIPGAYKADLWRYCILYIYGGIYIDIKLQPINGFRFKELLDKEYFVLHCPYIDKNCNINIDIKLIKEGKPLKKHFNLFDSYKNYYFKYFENHSFLTKKDNILLYNALIVTYPKNEILKECINRICHYSRVRYYGTTSLYPTGPGLLGQIYLEKYKLDDIELCQTRNTYYIVNKEKPILKHYEHYRKEQKKSGKSHYSELWKKRKIYQ